MLATVVMHGENIEVFEIETQPCSVDPEDVRNVRRFSEGTLCKAKPSQKVDDLLAPEMGKVTG